VLDDAVADVTNEQKKKMNKQNAQAFTKTKQKLKKFLTETGDDENKYEVQVAKFRANPVEDEEDKKKASKKDGKKKDSDDDSDDSDDSSDDSSSDDSSSDEDSEEKKPAKKEEKKEVKKKAKESDDDSDSSSSDSSSSSGSDSDASKNGTDSEAEPEAEFVEGTKIPKKYEFLLLPREKMTPEQKRWKWVRFDALPDDLKPLISVGNKIHDKDDTEEKAEKKKPAGARKARGEEEEHSDAEDLIQRDQDLDYTVQDNVDTVITKYRGQETSRKNFNIAEQIEVLDIMFAQQVETKTDNKINILMILISTYFTAAKKSVEGYFDRYTWLKSNEIITRLLAILKQKESDTLQSKDAE